MQIEWLAHMLDEAFDKRSAEERAEASALPKSENEKFKFGEVFTDGLDAAEIKELFTKIWPKWEDYVSKELDAEDPLELEGQRRDVDDWDVWKIHVTDCYEGGEDAMIDLMIDRIYDDFDEDKVVSLKEVVDFELDRLVEEAGEECDLETLERKGTCIWKGRMHWGGRYPG